VNKPSISCQKGHARNIEMKSKRMYFDASMYQDRFMLNSAAYTSNK
jgi:hypothetical protein